MPLYKPYLQILSHYEVLGVRTAAYEFWGNTVKPITSVGPGLWPTELWIWAGGSWSRTFKFPNNYLSESASDPCFLLSPGSTKHRAAEHWAEEAFDQCAESLRNTKLGNSVHLGFCSLKFKWPLHSPEASTGPLASLTSWRQALGWLRDWKGKGGTEHPELSAAGAAGQHTAKWVVQAPQQDRSPF